MRSLTIVIPGRPPTPNARPANWHVAANDRKKWKEIAANAALAAALDAKWRTFSGGSATWATIAEPIFYATAYEMEFVVPDRHERDWDNAVASSKPLTDGLVAVGLLAGDSTKFIAPEGRKVTFRFEKGADRVIIRVAGE